MKTLLFLTLIIIVSCGKPISVKNDGRVEPEITVDSATSSESLYTPLTESEVQSWRSPCSNNFNPVYSYEEVVEVKNQEIVYSRVVYSGVDCKVLQEIRTKIFLYIESESPNLTVVLIKNYVAFFTDAIVYSLNERNTCGISWSLGYEENIISKENCFGSEETQFGLSKQVSFKRTNNRLETTLTQNSLLEGF